MSGGGLELHVSSLWLYDSRAKVAASGRNPRMYAGSQPGAL